MNKKTKIISSKQKLFFVLVLVFFCLSLFLSSFILCKPLFESKLKVEFVKTSSDILIQTYSKGEKISFPDEPKREGFLFMGWSLEEENNEIITHEILVEKELTLYAQWKEQSFLLVYNNNQYDISCAADIVCENNLLKIVDHKTSIEINEPIKDGFVFDGWKILCNGETFSINEFKIENAYGCVVELLPTFKVDYIEFEVEKSELYEIKELSHDGIITISEKLTFELILNESVSESNFAIESTSGDVSIIKSNNKNLVVVENFKKDFKITITNLKLNEYQISFYNEDTLVVETFKHGDKLMLPEFEKTGYKLVGFKDAQGRYYSKEYSVVMDLELFAVWEECVFRVSFPKNNGMFLIKLNDEYLTSSKILNIYYGNSVPFEVELSNAYSNSEIKVFAITNNNEKFEIFGDGKNYNIENVKCDLEIVIENVLLNSYLLMVDGAEYGKFNYGSWIYVDGSELKIKDITAGKEVVVKTLINDEKFGGWVCENAVLSNCIIQDVVGVDCNINIYGNYSKKVSRIKFIANGGVLEKTEMVVVEGKELNLPTPIKEGYKFVGWFKKLVEVNTIVDENLSEKFNEVNEFYTVLYAGWSK